MSAYVCTICGKRPCRSPADCALLKPSYFRRKEAERRDAAKVAEREACAIGIMWGSDSAKHPRRGRHRR